MDTKGSTDIQSVRSRDGDWFTSLYHDCYRMLLAYARRRVDEQTADEVVADTFLVAWRRREDIPDGFERAWLYGVARNTIATAYRAARRRAALNRKLRGVWGPAPGGDDPDEASDWTDTLLPALGSLRPEDREILMLVARDELSHAEIGEALGISPNAVAIRVHRARKRLAANIDKAAVNVKTLPLPRRRRSRWGGCAAAVSYVAVMSGVLVLDAPC